MYDWSQQSQNVPNQLRGIANGGAYSTGTIDIPVYTIALGETHVFSPTLSNDFHAGYNHLIARQEPFEANTLGIPAQFGIGGVPQFPGNGGLPNIEWVQRGWTDPTRPRDLLSERRHGHLLGDHGKRNQDP